jgi:hypothetical protein
LSEIFDQIVKELAPKIKHLDPDLQEMIKAILYIEEFLPEEFVGCMSILGECQGEVNLSMIKACRALKRFKNK